MPCRHHDVQIFDDMRCCLACGETVFESTPKLTLSPSYEDSVPYQYAPLNYTLGQEIRLVVVFPGSSSDPVAIDIIHANLTDKPAYEAVSYAWATQSGDASLSQVVYCRGRTISVTKHCEAALQCFRRRGRNRTLWIDAISIDQTNISERNHQVAFMGNIYSNASQVIIYLGPGTDAIDIMLAYLNGEAGALKRFKRNGVNLGATWALSHVVREFLQLRWLDRVWVLQEVALAKLAAMTAGDRSVQWTRGDSVQTLLMLCKNLGVDPPSALHWLPASEPHDKILTVLHKSRNCSSSDARDKVFAVLGLAHPKYQQALPVDYSLTPEEVYLKLAIYLIEEEKELDVLKHTTGEDGHRDPYRLPSWVPRWDVKAGYDPLRPQFTASELEMLRSIWFSPQLLHFQGHQTPLDEDLLSDMLESAPTEEPVMTTNTWRQWLSKSLFAKEASLRPLSIPEIRAAALSLTQRRAPSFRWAIVSHDSLIDNSSPTPPRWPCLRIRAHHLDTIIHCVKAKAISIHEDDLPLCSACKAHAGGVICQVNPSVRTTICHDFNQELRQMRGNNRRTHISTLQSTGCTGANVKPGDEIWALDGADVPFVLRKTDAHYVLVGECYLYRALRYHPCRCCGYEAEPWSVITEIIDIW